MDDFMSYALAGNIDPTASDPLAMWEALQNQQRQQARLDDVYNMKQLGGIPSILAGFMDKSTRDDVDSANMNALQKQFEYNRAMLAQEQQAAAQAQQAANMQKYEALVPQFGEQGAKAIVFGGVDPKDLKQDQTTLMKNAAASGIDLSTPEGQAFMREQMTKSNAPTVNVNSGGEAATEFQKKQAAQNAMKFNDWEQAALTANETMANIGQLRQISELQGTGKMAEAGALIGQYFGTDAASNMQAYNAVSQGMVLQQAEKLKGAMSDGDIRLLEATMPSFGNDPRANEVIYGILERAAQTSIERYQNASKYVQEHGKLQGFKPKIEFAKREAKEQPQQQTPTQTATNPQTGERIGLVNGKWVPL